MYFTCSYVYFGRVSAHSYNRVCFEVGIRFDLWTAKLTTCTYPHYCSYHVPTKSTSHLKFLLLTFEECGGRHSIHKLGFKSPGPTVQWCRYLWQPCTYTLRRVVGTIEILYIYSHWTRNYRPSQSLHCIFIVILKFLITSKKKFNFNLTKYWSLFMDYVYALQESVV